MGQKLPGGEISVFSGATLSGLLPEELQNDVVYSVAIPAANADPPPAQAFVDFISAPANAHAWRKTGFELV
jgi:ABC-type molybdate transport system substrate-binding protein